VGVYGVNLNNPESAPVLVNETIGFRSPDRTIVAVPDGDLVRFLNETSGESWTLDTGGNWPRFSPDGRRILWVATDREGPYDERQSDVWLADLAGNNQHLLFTTFGGRTAEWLPDSNRVLMIGRDQPGHEEQTLFIYDVDRAQRTNLYTHKQLRGGDISPGGSWVVYFLAFADNPTENGLWVINTTDTTRRRLEVPNFGSYRWRDDETLFYIPFRETPEASMELWAVEVTTGQSERLTNPDTFFFSISNGDWEVSPDGRSVVFLNNADQNLWLISLY
jgi:Tol biopolymer transport system component